MNKSDKLEKNKSTISFNKNKDYTKEKVNDICKTLNTNTKLYNPQSTIDNINEYLKNSDMMGRILYSEISSYIFSLDESSKGIYITNLGNLQDYILKNKIDGNCKKVVIKLCDHCYLSIYQIESFEKITNNSVNEMKTQINYLQNTAQNIQEDLKNSEKGYISILGIFSSIILTFVGGITFSSSVLENINSASIYRLLITIDFLALILINVIYILIKFILVINDKTSKNDIIQIKKINYILISFVVGIGAMWFLEQCGFWKIGIK